MRILIVEDEADLRDAIAEGLQYDGYAVDCCGDGNTAYELLYTENYDLTILDLNLPGMDGLEVLRKIRDEKPNLKVLILSARNQVADKVQGLDCGANDYLGKPFEFPELEARVRSLLRRNFSQHSALLTFHTIRLDSSRRVAFVQDTALMLTKKELSILEYLMVHQDRVVSQEELIDHVWDANADSFSGAIRVHISSLRKKLKKELGLDPIATKIGEGYILTGDRWNHA